MPCILMFTYNQVNFLV
uniref:Uncharacterized protein n=1 Tax=Arundo donax TaxID=35708 RepID=A0A0A9FDJ5_ARUDO